MAVDRTSQSLLTEVGAAMLTGYQGGDGRGAEPLRALAAEAAAALTGRWRREEWSGLLAFGVADMYAEIVSNLQVVARCARQQAARRESWQVRWFGPRHAGGEGGKLTPLQEWEAAWVKSGVATLGPGGCVRLRLPPTMGGVPGADASTLAGVGGVTVCPWLDTGGGGVAVRIHLGVGMPLAGGRPHAGHVGGLSPGAPVLVGAAAAPADTQRAQRAAESERRRQRAAHAPPGGGREPLGALRLYTDGSYEREGDRAGFGLAVVASRAGGEALVSRHCGPVVTERTAAPWLGAGRPSNNTAELTGLGEALRYVLGLPVPPPQVTIISDSEYAMDAMLGITRPRKNRELVSRVVALWAQAGERFTQEGGKRLFVRHIYSHARGVGQEGHEWNEMADRLAARGVSGTVWGVGAAWDSYPPPPPRERRAHQVLEAERVARSAHVFGVLNVPVPVRGLLSPGRVDWLYRRVLQRLQTGPGAAHPGRREAESRLWAARQLLRQPGQQRRVRDGLVRAGLRPVTRRLRCAVDGRALREYVRGAGPAADAVPVHKDGTPYGATRRDLARALLTRMRVDECDLEGMGHVDLTYRHSALGAALVAAGHVVESREYACDRRADPFSLPRALRAVALGRSGVGLDDVAAFPNAKAACVAPCQRQIRQFLAHRELIMGRMGAYVFEGEGLTNDEQRRRVKGLFNSLDMDGSLGAWRSRVGLRDGQRPLADFEVQLSGGGVFRFGVYRGVMRHGTTWLAERLPAMRDFVVEHLRVRRDMARLAHPERTLASYVFQEAEGLSRRTKLQWAVRGGHTVQNLQHDGVVVRLEGGLGAGEAAGQLTAACTRALAYRQCVEHET